MPPLRLCAGNRFFWVGQHHCLSDNADCTDASHVVTAAQAPQRKCHQQATGLGAASHSGSSFSLSSFIDSACQPPNVADSTCPLLPKSSSVPSQKGVWSPPDTPSLCESSLTIPFPAASDSEALQDLVSEPILETTLHFLPASPFDTMDMSEDSNMWAANCLPEDVDKLLDWAADSAADSTFSDPSLNSAQLSMSCYELPQHSFELRSEAQGVQIQTSIQPSYNLGKPSTGCDTHTMTTAAQECPVSLALPRDPCSDELPYTRLHALTASPRAASQQAELYPDLNCDQSSWTLGSKASTPLLYDRLASDALQHQQLASDAHQHPLLAPDPLELLMQMEQDLCFGALPSLSSRDSSPSSGSDEQIGVPDAKGESQMKRRCGRPRVYDLDRPVPPGDMTPLTSISVCCRQAGVMWFRSSHHA